MSDLVNFIQIDPETNRIIGNIATLSFDIDSTSAKAPTYRLYAMTPRKRRIEIGGIWTKKNNGGNDYYSLSVNTGFGRFNANLGRYPSQDDENLFAVIPWS